MSGLPIVFGGGVIGQRIQACFRTQEQTRELFDLLEKSGVNVIDTAQLYEGSEKLLGECDAATRFTIDTKWLGSLANSLNTKTIVASAKESIALLKLQKVDIFYIHAPDTSVALSDWLPGVQQVYETGVFSRFGLSNFQASTVQEVYDFCKAHDYVLPTVYQGNYSAVARKQETVLLPTLRKLGIAFYAYSPIAGGFLTKTKEQVQQGVNRFSNNVLGGLYKTLYGKPAYLEALAEWKTIADEVGCSPAELAYRWVSYNSDLDAKYGDAIIIGASSLQQVEQTIHGLKQGKLPDSAAKKIDQIWENIKHEAPLDNFHK